MSRDKVQLRDVETGNCTGELRGVGDLNKMVWSPQGDRIAMVCLRKLALWKINERDDDENQARNESDGGLVLYIDLNCDLAAFSPDGLQIACSRDIEYFDSALYLYDTMTGTLLWASSGHTVAIASIVFSSHGDLIITASYDQTVRLWDVVSGQCRAVIQDFQHWVNDIAWVETPNAQYVIAGCQDGVVGMWQFIIDEDTCQVRLHWKTTNGMFNAEGAIIQEVQGLSPLNERILMTRAAAVEDGESEEDDENEESDEGGESEECEEGDESEEIDEGKECEEEDECEDNEENDECEKVVNQRAGLPPFEGHPA
ncbi:hypothetical protein BGX34_004652 [Mortierella sp. NVP85]|nr:hypothetical protein BGX34_004652 [Mortierella sp. NVP85]